jgi:hypothetical protein
MKWGLPSQVGAEDTEDFFDYLDISWLLTKIILSLSIASRNATETYDLQ